jgi:CheY-like chemotaxis protein
VHDRTAAAVGAAEVLREVGTLDLLQSAAGQPSPLITAARHADRRVRIAAIETILALDPTTSFAGASSVAEGLQFFAAASGNRKALVVDPRTAMAQRVAGWLTQVGYETDIATNGRDAFRLATNSPDYELAFIHTAIDRPRADDLVEQFRKDSRTAKLPIALVAIPEYRESAERLARGAALCHVVDEPQNLEAVKFQAARLLSLPGAQPVPLDVRKQHAAWAMATLAELTARKVTWLDALRISRALEGALYSPSVTPQVASLLANAGTASGQRELVQFAAQESLPLSSRELAALAFARSVANHGILLTSDQILAQYDRYNINAGRNPDTHKVMLIILDAIESPTKDKSQGEH